MSARALEKELVSPQTHAEEHVKLENGAKEVPVDQPKLIKRYIGRIPSYGALGGEPDYTDAAPSQTGPAGFRGI